MCCIGVLPGQLYECVSACVIVSVYVCVCVGVNDEINGANFLFKFKQKMGAVPLLNLHYQLRERPWKLTLLLCTSLGKLVIQIVIIIQFP